MCTLSRITLSISPLLLGFNTFLSVKAATTRAKWGLWLWPRVAEKCRDPGPEQGKRLRAEDQDQPYPSNIEAQQPRSQGGTAGSSQGCSFIVSCSFSCSSDCSFLSLFWPDGVHGPSVIVPSWKAPLFLSPILALFPFLCPLPLLSRSFCSALSVACFT